ncbi:MAG: sodium:alanine symporter family protein [Myxococcota bacterium]
MTEVLKFLLDTTSGVSGWLWGLPMVILLFGTGIWLTAVTGFVQIRNFVGAGRLVLGGAMSRSSGGSVEDGDISPFQALMTALSATVGNGNIAGVATAIATGGPGAAFWMWLTALVGMATKYAEAVLAIRFRVRMDDGSMAGGPMYYCRYGLKNRTLGIVLGGMFAVCGAMTALFGNGTMFQSQQIALAANKQFGVPVWITGLVLTLLVGAVILGGVKRIGAVAERLVPLMIIFYFVGALTVVLTHWAEVPGALVLIVRSAFDPQAVFGGAVGISIQQAVRFGVARGVLSNESGLGSAAIAHGAARTRYPVAQGSVAMMGTFIDTIVVCTLTAVVITVSGAYHEAVFLAGETGLRGSDLTVTAFNLGMPGVLAGWSGSMVVMASMVFGFTTLLGWSYYGQICLEYFFGLKAILPYRMVFLTSLFAGALFTGRWAPIVTNLGDICNASLAIPNLIGLVLLSGVVRRLTRDAYAAGHFNVHEATPLRPDH